MTTLNTGPGLVEEARQKRAGSGLVAEARHKRTVTEELSAQGFDELPLQEAVQQFPGYTFGEHVENVSGSLAVGLAKFGTIPANLQQFAGSVVESAGAKNLGRLIQTGIPVPGYVQPEKLLAKRQQIEELLPPSQNKEGFQPGNPMWWLEHAAEMAPQIAATFATGGTAAAAGLGARAALWTATLPTFGLEAQASYEEISRLLEEQGMDAAKARASAGPYAAAVGLVNAAMERIPAGELLTDGPIARALRRRLLDSTAGAIATRATRAGATGLTEGVTEVGQELTAAMAELMSTGDSSVLDGLEERLITAGTLGAGIGAATATVTRPVVRRKTDGEQDVQPAPTDAPQDADAPRAPISEDAADTAPSRAATAQTESPSPDLTTERTPDATQEETSTPARVRAEEAQTSEAAEVMPTRYADLRAKAKEMGLDPKGTRSDLIGRIRNAIARPEGNQTGPSTEVLPASSGERLASKDDTPTSRTSDRMSRTLRRTDAPSAKRGPDSGAGNPDSPTNLVNARALAKQIDRKINVPSDRLPEFPISVLTRVLRRIQKREVFDAVIPLVPVDMVDNLVRSERATDRLLHDPAVFSDVLASPDVPRDVTLAVVRLIERHNAGPAAKGAGDTGLTTLSGEGTSALRTGQGDTPAEFSTSPQIGTPSAAISQSPRRRITGVGEKDRAASLTSAHGQSKEVGPDKSTTQTGEGKPAITRAADEESPPDMTSARKVDMDRDRTSLGLDELDSPQRRSWRTVLESAQEGDVTEKANRLVVEVTQKPRALSDTETGTLVVKGADLKNQHADTMQKIGKATDPAEVATLSAEANRIEAEFDSLSTALRTSGTEKGRALASQKLTINQDFQLVSVLNRAKAAKGADLSAKQRADMESLTNQLAEKDAEVSRLESSIRRLTAQRAVRRTSRGAVTPRHRIDALYNKAETLLRAGCLN